MGCIIGAPAGPPGGMPIWANIAAAASNVGIGPGISTGKLPNWLPPPRKYAKN